MTDLIEPRAARSVQTSRLQSTADSRSPAAQADLAFAGAAVADGLFDRVIRRIFAAGLLLGDPRVDDRDGLVAQAVDQLDRAIADMRDGVMRWHAALAADSIQGEPTGSPKVPAGRLATRARPAGTVPGDGSEAASG